MTNQHGLMIVKIPKISSALVLLSVGVKRLPGSMTPTIILLSLVTWIPRVNKGDDTEKNCFIDFNKEVTRQINIDNDNITTTKQISCRISDMTLTSNNDLLPTMSLLLFVVILYGTVNSLCLLLSY
jgi:hypothetical protein